MDANEEVNVVSEESTDSSDSPQIVTVNCPDYYSSDFQELHTEIAELQSEVKVLQTSVDKTLPYLEYITGFLLFFVVVALCVFGYKFIRLFI